MTSWGRKPAFVKPGFKPDFKELDGISASMFNNTSNLGIIQAMIKNKIIIMIIKR